MILLISGKKSDLRKFFKVQPNSLTFHSLSNLVTPWLINHFWVPYTVDFVSCGMVHRKAFLYVLSPVGYQIQHKYHILLTHQNNQTKTPTNSKVVEWFNLGKLLKVPTFINNSQHWSSGQVDKVYIQIKVLWQ